jgi:tetratricopeptide (TPR) repeat protein
MIIAPIATMSSPVDAQQAWTFLTRCILAHDKRTPQALSELLALDSHHVRGWCVKGLAAMIMAKRELVASARDALATARALLSDHGHDNDENYITALDKAIMFDFPGAWEALERILQNDPDDAMAAKLSHSLRFMRGDGEGMLLSITRIVARVTPAHPHYGFLLGMQAFAREESGDYAGAEAAGLQAVALEATDAWGVHAVAHVHEMTGAPEAGLRWLTDRSENIIHCNNFAGHVFWHRALFHIELGDLGSALGLYDSAVRADKTDDFRDIANAASLLARLEMEGLDVGGRWNELADIAECRIGDGSLVFADLHYMLALAGAGRTQVSLQLAENLSKGMGRDCGDQSPLARTTGSHAAHGIAAFAQSQWADAARHLTIAHGDLQNIGGSHAQRDVFERLLIESAVRAGFSGLATHLLDERITMRGRDRFTVLRQTRIDSRLRRAGASPLARIGIAAAAAAE